MGERESRPPLTEEAATVLARKLVAQGAPADEVVDALVARGADRGMAVYVVYEQAKAAAQPRPRSHGPHRIGMAVVCLHISAVLYFLVGLLLFPLFMAVDQTGLGLTFAVAMFIFCLALIVGIELVVSGLHRRRFWAWVAGLCIFGLYVPSLFFVLGALGLWGLLDEGSRAEFGVKM
jgi:hypothetical protein